MSKAYIGTSTVYQKYWEESGVIIPPFTLYDVPQLALLEASHICGLQNMDGKVKTYDTLLVKSLRELIKRKFWHSLLECNPIYIGCTYDQSPLTQLVTNESGLQDLHLISSKPVVGGKPLVFEIATPDCLKEQRVGISGFFGVHVADQILEPQYSKHDCGLFFYDELSNLDLDKIKMSSPYLQRVAHLSMPEGANHLWDIVTRQRNSIT